MQNNWINQGGCLSLVPGDFTTSKQLPKGIYNITLDMKGWHLEKFAEEFSFNYKVYGLQTKFIEYFLKTYENTNENIGVLFNGVKGTGKTVTAKSLANKLNLPVIIVKDMGDHNQSMIEFLSSIDSDCIMFFDEFEKNFHQKDSTVLQLMDGVYNTVSRKVFLLTTNNKSINENLIGRPSRIRYVQEFGNLELEVVKDYLNDHLKDSSKFDDVIKFIDELEISTIDILKAIVSDINIHGFDNFLESKLYLNVIVSQTRLSCECAYIKYDTLCELNCKDPNFDIIKHFLKYSSIENRAILNNESENNDDNGGWSPFIFGIYDSPCKLEHLQKGMEFRGDPIVELLDNNKFIITNEDNEWINVYRVRRTLDNSLYNSNACDLAL